VAHACSPKPQALGIVGAVPESGQEGHEFKASLGYIEETLSPKKKKPNTLSF
jgi:hypothetical protein